MVETIKRPFRGKKLPNKNKNCLLLHPLDLVKAKLLQPLKGYKSQIHFFFQFPKWTQVFVCFSAKNGQKSSHIGKKRQFFRDSNYIDRTDDHPTGTIEIEFVAKKFIVFFLCSRPRTELTIQAVCFFFKFFF